MGARHVRILVLCFVLLVIAAVVMVQQPAQTVASPATTIDSFDVSQTNTQTGLGSTWSTASGSGVLGTEREITTTVTAVGTGTELTSQANGSGLGRLSHSPNTDVRGITLLTYDGSDGNPNLNPIGLGGVDLTVGGDDAFVIAIHSNDFGGTTSNQVTVTVYSNPSCYLTNS